MSSEATRRSAERMLSVQPALTRIAPLRELSDTPPATLLHAGPPFADLANIPAPVANAALAAARLEGWASDAVDLRAKLSAGEIRLAPAQDFGVVTPLAFVSGPSTPCLEVADQNAPERRRFSPLNDGPPPIALRFGGGAPEGEAILRDLAGGVAASLAEAVRKPIPMAPILAAGLAGGDDLHGRVAAAQQALLAEFAVPFAPNVEAYLKSVGQFALNAVMATSAVMLAAAEGEPGSALAVGAGGNGQLFGWRRAHAPQLWITAPAAPPKGPKFPGRESEAALPAIGDSAVIDALGFGAASLRFSPELTEALAASVASGEIDAGFFSERAHDAYVLEHPALGQSGLRIGLDLDRLTDAPETVLGIMLGMVEASGQAGLIGRGVAPWPRG